MSKYPQFSVSFSIGPTNKERLEAFEIYRRAFKAKKVSESTPPDCDDIHIMMDIYGTEILIGPGNVAGTDLRIPYAVKSVLIKRMIFIKRMMK